jgi:uncharacterized membrane protein YfcA
MFPAAILVATVAIAPWRRGRDLSHTHLHPGLRLPPEVVISSGLLSEVFGFASGLFTYVCKRLIDNRLDVSLLMVTVPLVWVGTWVAVGIESDNLKHVLQVERARRDIRGYARTKPSASCVTSAGLSLAFDNLRWGPY